MPSIKMCTLGNGRRLYYRSKADVDMLSRERLGEPEYLKHGLTLEDGAVVNGPSTHPQPCFAVRERNGQIEIGPTTS